MGANDPAEGWFSEALLRFQHVTLEPLVADLETGARVGPNWDEVAENDWSLGPRPFICSERATFARIAFDVSNCLVQLRACRDGLTEQRRRRQAFPSFTQAELLLIASDAIVYRLLERMASFCGHRIIKPTALGLLAKPPKALAEIRRRRGSHTHAFDAELVEASSASLLMSVMHMAPKDDEGRMRRLVLAEARRVYRARIDDQIIHLETAHSAACNWVNTVFETTEPTWTTFLRETA